jgi:NADH dehydrogenase
MDNGGDPMTMRIVVVGGGYAGLAAIGELQHLSQRDSEIILVDPLDGHELIPELPEALRPNEPIDEHIVPFKELFKDSGVTHVKDRVTRAWVKDRRVELEKGKALAYDWLLLAPGSVPAYPPIPGLKDHSLPLRNAYDTFRIKERLHNRPHQRVVVVGGGLTGTEVAGVLADEHDVWLVEARSRLLPSLGPGLARYARERLQAAGVTVMLGQKVTAVQDSLVKLERDTLHYDVLVWAGGIQPPAWLSASDLPVDDGGYPEVSNTGLVTERVFAAGDIWRVYADGQEVPQTAQLASLAGKYAAENLLRALKGQSLLPAFHPSLRGMLISLEPGIGVGWVLRGGIPVRGAPARALKSLSFHQYRLKLSRVFGHGWPFFPLR